MIDDSNGKVFGVDFDFIAVVMSSFKDQLQRERKLRYPGNFPVAADSSMLASWANTKDGYIKAEQFYYFKKDNLKFRTIGKLTEDAFNSLIAFIEDLASNGIQIEQIVDNL